MKRWLCVLICAVILAGCAASQKTDYKVFYYDATDGAENLTTIDKYEQIQPDNISSIPKTYTVEFNGEQLTGEYGDSHYSQMRLLNHYYGNPGITIKVENGTDKIRSITHLRNELNHVILTEEECEKIALDVLRSKVSDISRFKMESSFDEIWNTYDFRFEGNINGVLTTETLSVSVYVDGLLMHVSGTMIDSFEKIDISKIETGKIVEDYKTALTKAIEKETRNTGYEIISEHLTILPDGSLAMCYDVKMNGKSGLYRLYVTEAK